MLQLRKHSTPEIVRRLRPAQRRVVVPHRRIRCPLCEWTPNASSRWACVKHEGPPEFFTGGCGKAWNTFSTRGRCPGCQYQWKWTICLSCAQWSRHEDWYEEQSPKG